MLHIHGNVNDSEESTWFDHVVKSITKISQNEGTATDVITFRYIYVNVNVFFLCSRVIMACIHTARRACEVVRAPHSSPSCGCKVHKDLVLGYLFLLSQNFGHNYIREYCDAYGPCSHVDIFCENSVDGTNCHYFFV